MITVTEDQAMWLASGSAKTIESFFEKWRNERLQALNMGEPNYERGRMIQDEVAALHRLQREMIALREAVIKKERTTPDPKQEK
jgi:hypothetical protein